MSSYLTEVSTGIDSEVYDYHLPHTKTIDLIGEEFAPRSKQQQQQHANVIVESMNSASTSSAPQNFGPNVVFVNANGSTSMPIQVQQLLQQAQQQVSGGSSNNIVSVQLAPQNSSQLVSSSVSNGGSGTSIPHFTFSPLPPSGIVSSSTLVSLIQQPHITTQGNHDSLSFTNSSLTSSSSGGHTLLTTSLPFNPVTVDLPSNLSSLGGSEENGVLLCNLDDLSKYIPENFYSDLCVEQATNAIPISHQVVSMPDYLQTVMAGTASNANRPSATITTTTASNQLISSIPSHGLHLQGTPILSSSLTGSQLNSQLSNLTQIQGPPGNLTPHPITIQLPTQPQPLQSVKTVTYVSSPRNPATSLTTTQQPLRFAYTSSGERIAIQGFEPMKGNIQFQMKPQTLLQVDPSKLTVLQELPEVGKVVIQEARSHGDSIASILEEMKSDPDGPGGSGSGLEVTTGIPVAVSSLGTDPKKTTIKRVAAPPSTVILPNKRSRGIIFAGNTLPQGAIPIQINGMNALPISAVKSLPATINLSALTPTSMPPLMATTNHQVVAARKTRVEVVTPQRLQTAPGPPTALQAANIISKLTNNNNSINTSGTHQTIQFQKVIQSPPHTQTHTITLPVVSTPTTSSIMTTPTSVGNVNRSGGGSASSANSNLHKTIGNNKTCNWVFENGEICGKTFSKSYNLVVHMRMHEDVRPFSCSLCDQTFRQKAHLQRHETTHGLGSKVHRSPAGGNNSGYSNPKRKRKRSRGSTSGSNNTSVVVVASAGGSNLSAGNIILPNTPVAASALSENLQRRLAHVTEKFGGSSGASGQNDDDDMDDGEHDDESDGQEEMCVMSDGRAVVTKRRYIDINGEVKEDVQLGQHHGDDEDDDGKDDQQLIEYRQQLMDPNKMDSAYVEVQDEVTDLRDEDIIEQVQPDGDYDASQSIGLATTDSNGTIQIIVTNGGNMMQTTLADMVSRMTSHQGGGQTILLQQQDVDGDSGVTQGTSEDNKDGLDHQQHGQQQQHVVVTTSNELGHPGETIVIRNLDDTSPEMQKEILNALLQHHAETQAAAAAAEADSNGENVSENVIGETTVEYSLETDVKEEDDLGNDNVKVEAEPSSSGGGDMSPETLTAISGNHHHGDVNDVDIKSQAISPEEFMQQQ